MKEKNRLPTPPPDTTDEQPSDITVEHQGEDEGKREGEEHGEDDFDRPDETVDKSEKVSDVYDDDKEEEEEEDDGIQMIPDETEVTENPPMIDQNEKETLDNEEHDSTSARSRQRHDSTDKTKNRQPSVRFRSPSPPGDRRLSDFTKRVPGQTPTQVSVTPSGESSIATGIQTEQHIRVEITDKPNSNSQSRNPVPRSRREIPITGSQTPRIRKQPTTFLDRPDRSPTKLNLTDPLAGKRYLSFFLSHTSLCSLSVLCFDPTTRRCGITTTSSTVRWRARYPHEPILVLFTL